MGYFKWTDELKRRVQQLHNEGLSGPAIVERLYDEDGIYYPVRSVRRYMSFETPVQPGIDNASRDSFSIEPVYQYGSDGKVEDIKITAKYLMLQEQTSKTPEDILEYLNLDVKEWRIVSAIPNQWTTPTDDGVKWNFQLKVNVKPRTDNETEKIIERLTSEVKPLQIKNRIDPYRKNNLVIPLADLHFGILKLEHIQDKIAELLDIISVGYKTIVIEVIGDTLHSDKINSTETVSGTILEDVEMPNAIDEAMQFMETIVTASLKNANNVMIKSVGGNHDFDNSYWLMLWAKERFKQAKVDVNNSYRTAYLLDRVLISIQHGDVNKRIPGQILATEHRHMWGVATTAEIHTGHLHFDKMVDENGVILRQFSTPKPTDKWEKKNAFVGSSKLLHALVYNDDRLKVEHFI